MTEAINHLGSHLPHWTHQDHLNWTQRLSCPSWTGWRKKNVTSFGQRVRVVVVKVVIVVCVLLCSLEHSSEESLFGSHCCWMHDSHLICHWNSFL